MEKYIELNIKLRKETYENIMQFIGFENSENFLYQNGLPIDNDINDFVSGCVNYYIDQIKSFSQISGYEDLGKPYQIKNRFKEYLKQSNVNQKQLSEKTGIHSSNISTMFSNQKQPSLDYFLRVWVAFGCPPINEILYRE